MNLRRGSELSLGLKQGVIEMVDSPLERAILAAYLTDGETEDR